MEEATTTGLLASNIPRNRVLLAVTTRKHETSPCNDRRVASPFDMLTALSPQPTYNGGYQQQQQRPGPPPGQGYGGYNQPSPQPYSYNRPVSVQLTKPPAQCVLTQFKAPPPQQSYGGGPGGYPPQPSYNSRPGE